MLRRLLPVAIALFVLSPAFGQDATEPSLKAALIFNFARFTVWPTEALPATGPFAACVVGDTAVGQALERSTRDRLLAGHRMTVTRNGDGESLRSCHLVYIGRISAPQIARILSDLRGSPVLTITDLEGAAQGGGIARVFVEDGRMRFNLDNGLAKRGRLQLSSKLLTLASHVLDEPVSGGR